MTVRPSALPPRAGGRAASRGAAGVEVAEYRLHRSSRTGSGPGPVFVLVHGIGMSHRYFDRLRAELLDHGEVAVFDLPGFGGTPRPSRPLGVADYAHLIGQALEEARLSACVLVGHSMGAQFVTELALQRPDLVALVVLIGPVTDTAHPSAVRNAMTLALDTLLEKPSTTALVAGAYLRCGIRWYLEELPVMLGYRLDDRLVRVDQPVLILRGSLDPIAGRAWCRRLGRTAPRGTVVEIPGQPHAVHRGAATPVAREILQFVAALPRPAGPATPMRAPLLE
ncbi:alpha/beta fold hydrolase [Arthrobacter sp. MDB2-24]